MPNRTVYLPEHLDELSRRLGVNLSQLTQKAIEEYASQRAEDTLDTRVKEARARMAALNISWPEGLLERERAEADER